MSKNKGIPNQKPIFVTVALTAEAKAMIEQMCERTGMTQLATLSRLVEWFSKQNDLVRAAVLGHLPEGIAPDLSKVIMKRMAEQLAK